MVVKEYDSPYGLLYMASIGHYLCLCSWQDLEVRKHYLKDSNDASGYEESNYKEEWEVISKAVKELEEYFDGTRQSFDIPLKLMGTEFQKRVWEILQTIPYGDTVTYTNVARMIGKPKAVRAVANACAKNPVSIFIPCHRVVGRDGRLTGYAGGIETKKRLIDLEHVDSMDEAYSEMLAADA